MNGRKRENYGRKAARRGSAIEAGMHSGRWSRVFHALCYLPLYGGCIALVAAFWRSPVLLTGLLIVVAGAMLLRWRRPSDVLYFLLAAILGPLGEFVAIGYGAWEYSLPLLNIPLWLPLAWGIAGIYLKKTTEALAGEVVVKPHNQAASADHHSALRAS